MLHLVHGEAERARDVLEAAEALGQTVDEAVGALLPLRLPRQRVAAAVGDVGAARGAHQIVGESEDRLRLAERAVPLVNFEVKLRERRRRRRQPRAHALARGVARAAQLRLGGGGGANRFGDVAAVGDRLVEGGDATAEGGGAQPSGEDRFLELVLRGGVDREVGEEEGPAEEAEEHPDTSPHLVARRRPPAAAVAVRAAGDPPQRHLERREERHDERVDHAFAGRRDHAAVGEPLRTREPPLRALAQQVGPAARPSRELSQHRTQRLHRVAARLRRVAPRRVGARPVDCRALEPKSAHQLDEARALGLRLERSAEGEQRGAQSVGEALPVVLPPCALGGGRRRAVDEQLAQRPQL